MVTALSPTPTSTTPSATSRLSGQALHSAVSAAGIEAQGSLSALETLSAQRIASAKFAYTTRNAQRYVEHSDQEFYLLSGATVEPQSGDIVVARVVEIGQHKRLESPQSRRRTLFVGDEIVLAYGNRYASDQFHAVVPPDLGSCHLVAAGGVAARVVEQHSQIQPATVIEPLGLLATRQGRVTMASTAPRDFLAPHAAASQEPDQNESDREAPAPEAEGAERPRVIAVVGSSMNSGKTTTAGCLIRGLASAGYAVGAGKITGTGAGNDPGLYLDSGAQTVVDFTDYGFPTTFREDHSVIRQLLVSEVRDLTDSGAEVIVVEIADGLFQAETRRLLDDSVFCDTVDQIMFAAGDALGAAGGIDLLRSHGLEVVTVTGLLTASPLAAAEARAALDVPITGTYALTDPEVAETLFSTGTAVPVSSRDERIGG